MRRRLLGLAAAVITCGGFGFEPLDAQLAKPIELGSPLPLVDRRVPETLQDLSEASQADSTSYPPEASRWRSGGSA